MVFTALCPLDVADVVSLSAPRCGIVSAREPSGAAPGPPGRRRGPAARATTSCRSCSPCVAPLPRRRLPGFRGSAGSARTLQDSGTNEGQQHGQQGQQRDQRMPHPADPLQTQFARATHFPFYGEGVGKCLARQSHCNGVDSAGPRNWRRTMQRHTRPAGRRWMRN